jgi:hypothetical protein
MLIGTYRPADVIVSAHPLKTVTRELQAHGLCHELWPDCLSEIAVGQYLADRFPGDKHASALEQAKQAQEAHRILADVYGWFTEGFNTPDLVEARRLLHGR